ncbi:hypothetical protein D9757_006890 [Collybiopsis confluens]|uniref:NACHT domain-containing protein n=1 Tax=Collybiopsis confluens TaxID=2823264 RepID=A0A8H5HPK1_9AGAR|nr:hypothetical protein D9757_006890 [Collybiopsis confluens]
MLSSGIGARIASLLRNLWTNKSAENHDHPVVGSSESQQTSPTENAPNSLGTVGKLLRSLSGRKGRPQDSVAEKDDTPNVSPHIDSLTDHPSSPQVRTTSKTIAETASILLKLLSAVADAAPWTPLKPIVTGMEILFAQYEKRGENDEELERLRESLFRLSLKLEELKTMPKSVTYLLKILTPTLNVIQQKIENFPKDSLLSSIFHANQNAKTIADISRMISDIVDDILMHLSIVTFKHTNDLFNIVTASLQTEKLKELIKAKDAMELRGCGREPCYPGTRLPILKEIITDWIPSSTSERVFCLSGPSGSGKTTLALTIFDQVKEEGRLPCATFFCSSLSEDASNPHNIFPTLAAQLALLEDIYPIALAELDRGLLDMYETSNMRHQTLLVKLLEEIGKGRNTLLVIDGLDECKHKDEAARVVETLLKIIADIPSVKLLISCSTNSDVHSRLSGEVLVHELSLEDIPSSDKNHDMRILLAVELGTSIAQENMVRLFEDVEQANCSFLVALMACKAVVQKQSFEMQRAAFKGFLNAQEQFIYHGFIKRAYPEGADDDARQRFTAALVIVAFGRNSLNVTTLNRLLGFSGDGLLVQDFFVKFPERILSIQSHMVRICHPLFQAYLKSGEVDERFGSQHLYITKLLLEFMNDSLDRCRSGTVTRKDRSLDETEQILLYACRYWPNHLDKVDTMISGTESIQDLVRMMQDFFHNKLLYWLEVLLGLDDLGLIASVLRKLLAWTEKHCRSDAVFRIVADALTLFELSKEALKRPAFGHENAQSRVYRIFFAFFHTFWSTDGQTFSTHQNPGRNI